MKRLNKNQKGLLHILPFVIIFVAVGIFLLANTWARSKTLDLSSYYPNWNVSENRYLEGFNYVNGDPERAVLWFEKQGQQSFKIFNSAPEDQNARCHWDLLSWWDDDTLRYSKTDHTCPGDTPNRVVYLDPIVFLPRYWNKADGPWQYNGSSPVKYYENGRLKCRGVNEYVAEILGFEQITDDEKAIHWRSTQTTTWTSGNVPGKCSEGSTTRWQEDYWLGKLPAANNKTKRGLRRSLGGNQDISTDTWDIWFDSWTKLP